MGTDYSYFELFAPSKRDRRFTLKGARVTTLLSQPWSQGLKMLLGIPGSPVR